MRLGICAELYNSAILDWLIHSILLVIICIINSVCWNDLMAFFAASLLVNPWRVWRPRVGEQISCHAKLKTAGIVVGHRQINESSNESEETTNVCQQFIKLVVTTIEYPRLDRFTNKELHILALIGDEVQNASRLGCHDPFRRMLVCERSQTHVSCQLVVLDIEAAARAESRAKFKGVGVIEKDADCLLLIHID